LPGARVTRALAIDGPVDEVDELLHDALEGEDVVCEIMEREIDAVHPETLAQQLCVLSDIDV
jgi:hypothetical protein